MHLAVTQEVTLGMFLKWVSDKEQLHESENYLTYRPRPLLWHTTSGCVLYLALRSASEWIMCGRSRMIIQHLFTSDKGAALSITEALQYLQFLMQSNSDWKLMIHYLGMQKEGKFYPKLADYQVACHIRYCCSGFNGKSSWVAELHSVC